MLVLDASSANIDIVEAFYVFLGLFCFDEASRSSSNLLLFLSGVSLALGGSHEKLLALPFLLSV